MKKLWGFKCFGCGHKIRRKTRALARLSKGFHDDGLGKVTPIRRYSK